MSITHSKAKMFEYNVPIEYHLKLEDNKPDEWNDPKLVDTFLFS